MALIAAGAEMGAASKLPTFKDFVFDKDLSKQGLDQINKSVNLGFAITDLVNNAGAPDKIKEQAKLQALAAGIILPNQKTTRRDLVLQGKMNKYYSRENIEELVMDGKLPAGWTEITLIEQGFGAVLTRKRELEAAKQRFKLDAEISDLKSKLFYADQKIKEQGIKSRTQKVLGQINNYQAW